MDHMFTSRFQMTGSGQIICLHVAVPDDRFILKQMSRPEVQSFVEFAPQYIRHVTDAYGDKVSYHALQGFSRHQYVNTLFIGTLRSLETPAPITARLAKVINARFLYLQSLLFQLKLNPCTNPGVFVQVYPTGVLFT